jgi:hypothetical protein
LSFFIILLGFSFSIISGGAIYIYDIQYTNSTGYKFFTLMFADNIYLCSHQNYKCELEFIHIGPSSLTKSCIVVDFDMKTTTKHVKNQRSSYFWGTSPA